MKKTAMKEMIEKFEMMPVSRSTITVDGKEYTVVSHYTGNKDVDTVIRTLAEKKAYEETAHKA
ncbi:MAG: hypothetical protein IKP68_08895 [Clostridia bacterium]|nr:hypothetical protein [Clostridia bacterium]